MDPRFGRFLSSPNGKGTQLGNQSVPVLPDYRKLDSGSRFGNGFSIYDQISEESRYESSICSQSFRGIQFPPVNDSQVPSVSVSPEDETHEDCDFSDAILGYISQVLMEEDVEDKSCMLQESLDLQAAEKSFYEVLGKKYPPSESPSPSSNEILTSIDQFRESPDDCLSFNNNTYGNFSNNSGYLHDSNNLNASNILCFGALNQLSTSVSSSNSGNNIVNGLQDSPASTLQASDLFNGNQMMWQFRKGVEEANKFLLSSNRLLTSFNEGASLLNDQKAESGRLEVEVEVERITSPTGSRVRKNPYGENGNELQKEERNIKQPAICPDPILRSDEMDLILLSSMGQGKIALDSFRETLREERSKDIQKDGEEKGVISKGRRRARGRKQNRKKEVIDLRTLLVTCAQAVAADDRRSANELLKQIRQHASPFGDGNQRLAHGFANGLEARLAGTGSQIHKALVNKKTSSADYIKAYHLYIASSPFRKISNFASNRTIREKAGNAMRIHIIDFGILYGFQWPTFFQRIEDKEGGPPRIRITGIEFPQPGFKPAERIEETGRRLAEYARLFNVPFEYNAIAKRWENVKVEDLMIEEGEFLVVNCMYRSKNLLDETVGVDSARTVVLNLIKSINPDIFIHGILNGSYNAPFFVTRFREALFHFSALFDMLETNVPRERSERMLLEREIFGREALNVIACEGWERIERPETYKQWHVRNLRAGFVPVPFTREIIKDAQTKMRSYHKDFMIDENNKWLLQGWKGRIIYAISCWKVA